MFGRTLKKIHRVALIAAAGVALTPMGLAPALAKTTRDAGVEMGTASGAPQTVAKGSSYVIGAPLPNGVEYAPVPPRIMVYLGAPPKGYTYGIVGEDILLISLKNKRVMEALSVTP